MDLDTTPLDAVLLTALAALLASLVMLALKQLLR
jgi:hypothetical protein